MLFKPHGHKVRDTKQLSHTLSCSMDSFCGQGQGSVERTCAKKGRAGPHFPRKGGSPAHLIQSPCASSKVKAQEILGDGLLVLWNTPDDLPDCGCCDSFLLCKMIVMPERITQWQHVQRRWHNRRHAVGT